MGSCAGKRCQRWLTPILSARHGCTHETQISVRKKVKFEKKKNYYNQSTCSQVGQTSTAEVKKRDLRAELLAAEQDAKNKKRKAEGKPPLGVEDAPAPVDDESNKRRKLLQEALELDKDDDDEEEDNKDEKDDENER
jgi:Cwf15/Cwc15 cell cycle control protein